MLQRKAYTKLLEWKNTAKHKALCVVGARQVGKTTLIRKFAEENYANYVEINFIRTPKAKKIFSEDVDVDTLIINITAFVGRTLVPGKTLIFLDEIQECPAARAAIKFLVEDGRFDYMESGFLLGTNLQGIPSYPVGFEEIYQMYPMDFEEFQWACGVQPEVIAYLKKCFAERKQVSDIVHDQMLQYFLRYIVVGGMPKAVQQYVDTKDMALVLREQHDILMAYKMDINRYSDLSDKPKIKEIFENIPNELNAKNRRFKLVHISSFARHNRYGESFLWLADAGVALPCYNITEPKMPLKMNEKHNLFKLYQSDTGLLCAACGDNLQFALLTGDVDINKGSILENVIAQQLLCNGHALHYYDSKSCGEVDFVCGDKDGVTLIEVKSGKDYYRHAALDNVRKNVAWTFHQTLVLCKGNLEQRDGVIYLPWYMVVYVKP